MMDLIQTGRQEENTSMHWCGHRVTTAVLSFFGGPAPPPLLTPQSPETESWINCNF